MKPSPVQMAQQLANIRDAIQTCETKWPVAVQDDCARALGHEDQIPDEPELPLTRAA